MRVLLLVLLSLSTVLVTSGARAATKSPPRPPKGATVYDAPSPLPRGQHGDLVWAVPIDTRVPNAVAWKILYLSTDVHDTPAAVSGMVIAPRGKPPAGGRPIVTFAHGTTGLARVCAPSMVADPAKDAIMYVNPRSQDIMDSGVPSLSRMIAAGWVVVATDYLGLGGPGFHQYLVGPTAGRNILDAALAAMRIPEAGAGRKVAVLGWSEGGQGAVWAGQLASYAAGADVVGAAALAPVNPAEQIRIEREIVASGKKLPSMTTAETVMTLYATARTFPGLDPADVLTPSGVAFVTESAKYQCSKHMGFALDYDVAQNGPATRSAPGNAAAWDRLILENALGNPPSRIPMAVFQGDDDPTIFPAATEAYVRRACESGTVTWYAHYPRTDHLQVPFRAADDYLAWMADRFAGRPPPTSCK